MVITSALAHPGARPLLCSAISRFGRRLSNLERAQLVAHQSHASREYLMPRALRTLALVLVIGIVALFQPIEALCKAKGSNIRSADIAAASGNSTDTVAVAGASAGNATSAVDAGDIADRSSDNKIQHAPKKRMKNKLAFDAMPAKAKAKAGASQKKGKSSSSS